MLWVKMLKIRTACENDLEKIMQIEKASFVPQIQENPVENSLAIQRTLLMKTSSYKTGSQGSKCFVKGHTNAVKAKKTSPKFVNEQNDVKEKNHPKENEM